MELIAATCQFPVTADVNANLRHVLNQMTEAARRGADVAHFAETALPGYAGTDLVTLEDYPWTALEAATRQIMAHAKKLKLWVMLGSMHRLTGGHKPHNCVYVIDARGRIADRYDKLFCTGDPSETKSDLKYYAPGDHFVTFRIRGVKCGVLICHDFRYPELSREYRRLGAGVIFYSYYQGGLTRVKSLKKGRILGAVVPAAMQAYASSNHQWISATNSCRRYSAWPSFTVQPDGLISGRLSLHRSSVLITKMNDRSAYEDSSQSWRDRALKGILHSGTQVHDPRSRNRQSL